MRKLTANQYTMIQFFGNEWFTREQMQKALDVSKYDSYMIIADSVRDRIIESKESRDRNTYTYKVTDRARRLL